MGDFAQELELQNLQLLVLIHANDTIVAINGDKLTGLADIVTMKYFDLGAIFRLLIKKIIYLVILLWLNGFQVVAANCDS